MSFKPRIYKTHPWISLTNPPLANAPMLNIATAPLATSISLAGGIGFIAGGYNTTLSNLETNLHHASQLIKSHADQSNPACKFYTQTGVLPLGVGFINWGVDRDEALRILRMYKVAAVWLFAPRDVGDFGGWVEGMRGLYEHRKDGDDVDDTKSKEWSTPQIWIQISSVAETTTALKALHPDVLVIQGSDAGGHGLARSASLLTLLPEISNLIAEHYPPSTKTTSNDHQHQPPTLLAAGGLTNGLTLSAALLLGATGGVMGTRFLASHEANIPRGYQNAILRAVDGGVNTVRSTVYDRVRDIKGWPEQYDGRGVINASYLDAVGGMSDEENRGLYVEEMGRGDEGWDVEGKGRMTTYAGTGVGLVKEVLGAGEIVRQVWGEVVDVKRRVRARL